MKVLGSLVSLMCYGLVIVVSLPTEGGCAFNRYEDVSSWCGAFKYLALVAAAIGVVGVLVLIWKKDRSSLVFKVARISVIGSIAIIASVVMRAFI